MTDSSVLLPAYCLLPTASDLAYLKSKTHGVQPEAVIAYQCVELIDVLN